MSRAAITFGERRLATVQPGTSLRQHHSPAVTADDKPVFEFDEISHLMRVHLKLGLEDLGFSVMRVENAFPSSVRGQMGTGKRPLRAFER